MPVFAARELLGAVVDTAPPLVTSMLIRLAEVSVMLPPRRIFRLLRPAPTTKVSVPELLEVMLPLIARAAPLLALLEVNV